MRRDPMALLEAAGANEFGSVGDDFDDDGEFGDVGYDPAAIGYDPSSVGAVAKQYNLSPTALRGAMAKIADQKRQAAMSKIRNLTAVGHVPAGTIATSGAIGIGATVNVTLQSFIPLRIYRVDMVAAVTATGADAGGSVVVNSFQFANRGLFDGTGNPTMNGFRPDANGRPPIRNIVVYPNTPITLSLTNNNAAAVTASITLYGSTVGS